MSNVDSTGFSDDPSVVDSLQSPTGSAAPATNPDRAGAQGDPHFQRWTELNCCEQIREQLQAIFAQAAVGIAQGELDGRLIQANPRFCQFVGYPLAELQGLLMEQLLDPADWAIAQAQMQQLRAGTVSQFSLEQPYIRKDGERVWGRLTVSRVHSQVAAADYLIAVVEDISDLKRCEAERQRVEASLRQSEALHRLVISSISDAVFITDDAGTFTFICPNVAAIFGYTPAEVEQQGRIEGLLGGCLVAPDQLLPGEEIHNLEWTITDKFGTLHTLLVNIKRVAIADGTLLYTCRDISDKARLATDRKRAEAALKASQEQVQRTLDFASIGYWEWNLATGQLSGSDLSVAMLGYQPGEIEISYPLWRDRVHPEDLQPVEDALRQAIATQTLYEAEYRVIWRDGSIHWLLARGQGIYDSHRQIQRLLGVLLDITDRKQEEGDRLQAEAALRQSEAMNRVILNAVPDLMIRMNRDGTYLDFKPAKNFPIVMPFEDMRGANVQAVMPPDIAQKRLAAAARALQTGETQVYEFQVPIDGQIYWRETRIVVSGAEEVLLLIRDITARKQAEIALQNLIQGTASVTGEDFFAALVEHIAKALNVQHVAVSELHGESLTTLAFWSHGQLLPNLTYALEQTPCERSMRAGRYCHPADVQAAFPGDPDLAWLNVQSYLGIALVNTAGQAIGNLCVLDSQPLANPTQAENILRVFAARTSAELERNRAIAALHQLNRELEGRVEQRTGELQSSEQKFRAIFNSTFQFMALLTPEGRILEVNQTALDFAHLTLADVVGQSVWETSWFSFSAASTEGVRRGILAAGQGEFVRLEIEAQGENGMILDFDVSFKPLLDDQGQISHVLGEGREISLLKQAERTLKTANAELARATRLKDEFLANMSHELRTPLSGILGMAQLLQMQGQAYGFLSERQARAVTVIEQSGRHLLALINDILDLAKIESGKMELRPTPVNVASLCRTSLTFVKQQAASKHLQLAIAIQADLDEILIDELRMRQALINLLSNAVKFTPDGGSVTLEVTAESSHIPGDSHAAASGMLQLSVIDTGIGIAPEEMHKLFQAFTQLDGGLSRRHEGTGLGLNLVKRIVELHGGTVRVASQVGKGSRFTIELPDACVLIPASSSELSSRELGQGAGAISSIVDWQQAPLILIAEDNQANVETLGDYLQLQGFQIAIAHNGMEAMQMTRDRRPDLILMDIHMPEMDGLEAIRRLRLTYAPTQLPIIALTALAMPGDRDRCLSQGANDYLAKPFNLSVLLEMIHHLLSIREPTADS